MMLTESATHPRPPSRAESRLQVLRHPGSLTRWVVIGTTLSLLVAWGAVMMALVTMRRDASEADSWHRANLARTSQKQPVRVFAATDQATMRLRDAVRDGSFDLADAGRFANETGLAPRILTQLSRVGPDGCFRGSNLDPDGSKSRHVDLSTREHVRVHLVPQKAPGAPPLSAGGPFVGKPALGKVSGKWTIQLSRRVDGADGRVLGDVVASLDPLYFEAIYRGVALAELMGGTVVVQPDVGAGSRITLSLPIGSSVNRA